MTVKCEAERPKMAAPRSAELLGTRLVRYVFFSGWRIDCYKDPHPHADVTSLQPFSTVEPTSLPPSGPSDGSMDVKSNSRGRRAPGTTSVNSTPTMPITART